MANSALDPRLASYVGAPSDETARGELSALLEFQALPLARRIVGRKLRAWGTAGRTAFGGQEREDVVAEAMLTLVQRLAALRDRPDSAPIENLENYTAAVVHSACAHFIRARHPERARLKNRLRYVLTTTSALALWSGTDGELVCGLARWREHTCDASADEAVRRALALHRREWLELSPKSMGRALVEVFASSPGPLRFDVLVGIVAEAGGLVEPRDVADASGTPALDDPREITIDRQRLLATVWTEVRELPVMQRVALLLNLRSAKGAGLLWLLPIAGVATLRQIAATLEIPAVEFASLWRELPLDDDAIGRRIGCTRQQVINLRVAARKRLSNRLRRPGQAGAVGLAPVVNLDQVSTSLGGSSD